MLSRSGTLDAAAPERRDAGERVVIPVDVQDIETVLECARRD